MSDGGDRPEINKMDVNGGMLHGCDLIPLGWAPWKATAFNESMFPRE